MSNKISSDPGLERFLEYLKEHRGFDFTGYKRTTLARRIQKRMQTLRLDSYGNYSDYLEVHPEEFTLLFNSILINVTSFFRDEPAWEIINTEILPRILDQKNPNEPIRIWTAGCASGEETYTIAMLLAENLGLERFKQQVKIYSTDLDEDALTRARQALYDEAEIKNVPDELVEKYFDHSNHLYTFNKELRRQIIFGRHDLIQDAPISRIDLLICRNVLMYFNAETQTRILNRLSYALNESGFLFLGKAEMLLTHAQLFGPVNLKNRIFRKASGNGERSRFQIMPREDGVEPAQYAHHYLSELAFDTGPVAQLVLDMHGDLVNTNEKTRQLFNLNRHDYGKPFQDLELSYRPVDLRSAIEQAYAKRGLVRLKEVELPSVGEERRYTDILLMPLNDLNNHMVGINISFIDVSEYKRLYAQLEHANQELETAMEELQSTNEELETTNEELQSTVEELETTNEELQSTNEELETMNEELQSTNEELETMNDELNQRTEDLNTVNDFLEAILSGLHGGVIVLDKNMNVRIWNHKSEDLWGLHSDEVHDRNLYSLDFGLPVERLKKPVRSIFSDGASSAVVDLPAINRRGRKIDCKVTCTPLVSAQTKEIIGVILVVEPVEDRIKVREEEKGLSS